MTSFDISYFFQIMFCLVLKLFNHLENAWNLLLFRVLVTIKGSLLYFDHVFTTHYFVDFLIAFFCFSSLHQYHAPIHSLFCLCLLMSHKYVLFSALETHHNFMHRLSFSLALITFTFLV